MSTEKKENIALFIQVFLASATLFVGLVSIFIPDFLIVTEGMVTVLLFDMAYNNHLLYKTKWVTPIYTLVGFVMFGIFMYMVINYG